MNDDYRRREAVDYLTLILCMPLLFWLGWWGLLPAFLIGFGINVAASRLSKHEPCEHEFEYLQDMTGRDSEGNVSCRCHKCDEVFKAECGLDLPGRLVQLDRTAAQSPANIEQGKL